MPRAFPLLAAAAAALLLACERPGDPAKVRQMAGRALRGTLTYPNSSIVSIAAGDEAAELVMTSPDSVGAVATWFREALPLNGWKITRAGRDANGVVSIYAEQGERPLWLTLRPSVGGMGTTYTLIGTATDSSKTRTP